MGVWPRDIRDIRTDSLQDMGLPADTDEVLIRDTTDGIVKFAQVSDVGIRLEEIQDNLGTSFIIGGDNITVTYDDVNDTLTIDGSGGGVTDHGALTGLADDDHSQYLNNARHNSLDHSAAMGSVVISDISNVVVSAVIDNEILGYDNASGNWINQTAAELGLATDSHTHPAGEIISGTFSDARIAESNVTQHEAALSITESQITDLDHYTSTDFNTDFSSKSTTDLSEGTNLYYTTVRANSAIDARVDKAFVDALNVDADTLDGLDNTDFVRVSGDTMTGALNVGTMRFEVGAQGQQSFIPGSFWMNELAGWETRGGTINVVTTGDATVGSMNQALDPFGSYLTVNGGTGGGTAEFTFTGVSFAVHSNARWLPFIQRRAGNAPTNIKVEMKDQLGNWVVFNDETWSEDFGNVWIGTETTVSEYPPTEARITFTMAAGEVGYFNEVSIWNDNAPLGYITQPSLVSGRTWYANQNFTGGLQSNGTDVSVVGHVHDTSDITTGTFADARIAQSNVTQHEAALSITESQISNLDHLTIEEVQDNLGTAFVVAGTDISVSYDDVANTLTISSTATGVTDHGALTGLTDDDHTHYSLASGARAFTGTVAGVDPTADAHLATKAYIDTLVEADTLLLMGA